MRYAWVDERIAQSDQASESESEDEDRSCHGWSGAGDSWRGLQVCTLVFSGLVLETHTEALAQDPAFVIRAPYISQDRSGFRGNVANVHWSRPDFCRTRRLRVVEQLGGASDIGYNEAVAGMKERSGE
jgi:hypothetical protein